MNDESDEVLTAEEVARRLSLRPSTVRRWAREGRIPAVRPTARVIRFDIAAVLAALRRLSTTQEVRRGRP